jgi:DTW domain-containing protein
MQADFVPRAVCARCTRPVSVCVCEGMVELDTRTRIVILQHPRESIVPINTARLAELVFTHAERHVGIEFAEDRDVVAALSSESAPPILLFPGEHTRDLATEAPAGPVTLVVIDGTWSQAKKLLKKNPMLQRLPRYALAPAEPSRYRIRREPAPHCVSTIEAIVAAVEALEKRDARVALAPFDNLVEHQLRNAREVAQKRQLANRKTPLRPRAARRLATRFDDLVVAYGEANAWPRGTALGPTPELAHWAAERISTGERFEARIRPENPLSPSFANHTRLPVELVLEGESRESFVLRWNAFARPNDVLCCWGYYASELVKEAGANVFEHVDVRVIARQQLKKKSGDVLECARTLGAEPVECWAPGRTGQRLAGVAAVVRALLELARSPVSASC